MTLRATLGAAAGLAAALLLSVPAHAARLFVSNENGNTVSVIDLASNKVVATIEAGERPRGIGASPDGKWVYTALGDEDAIGVIDAQALKTVRKIPGGSDPEAIAAAPDGVIWVSNEDENLASAVDPGQGKVLHVLKVGIEPEGVAISPDGKYV